MKTRKLLVLSTSVLALLLAGCDIGGSSSSKKRSSKSSNSFSTSNSSGTTSAGGSKTPVSYSSGTYIPTSTSEPGWDNTTIEGDFTIANSAGQNTGYSVSGSVITISTADTYTLKGNYSGRIVVNVSEDDEVELDLDGVAITASDNSPIFVSSAKKVKIKANKDTSNKIVDNRSKKTSDSDSQGEGAIYAKSDLNFVGKGELQVEGNYNNGIHTSKDLKIKNIKLKSYGYQHAIRGGNSIEITNTSTYVYAIGATGDGLKSNDAAVNDSGKQKGNINIYGGTINIHSKEDGIDAAYNVNIEQGTDDDSNETTVPTINIYTDKYATLTKSISRPGPGGGGGGPGGGGWEEGNTDKSSTTAKGIKGNNSVNISDGQIYIKAYDDGIHSNTEALTDSDGVSTGVYGVGNITISGGTITIDCSDDGMHADNILAITGGILNVVNSYEGLEGHEIKISGGTSKVYGKDDGVNAGGNSNPTITITGGYLEVYVSPSGDTDGIDSNGTYTQSGGIVIAKGPSSSMASALDHEGRATVNGGTLIVLGAVEGSVTTGGSVKSVSGLSLHSSGNHTVTIGGTSYSFNNSTSYAKTICYSDTTVTGS